MKIPIILLTLATFPWCVLAADVNGTWQTEFKTQIGARKYTFTLKQDGTNVTGKADSEVNAEKRQAELKEGRVDGDTVSFVEMLNLQGNELRIHCKGKVSIKELNFTRELGDVATEELVAKREPA